VGTTVTFNNTSYIVPALGDSNWGDNVSNYLIAIASGSLQKSGGNFTLTADVDFGATYGLKAAYFISKATNPSGTGVLRLGNTQSIGWRNAANSADLNLSVSALDVLEFGGTKLLLSGQIVNADIATLAAIALTKLAALPTTERVLVSNATGVITESAVTSTTLGYLDATSSIQTQLNGKEPSITTLGISKGGTNSSTALTNDKVIISNAGAIVESAVTTTTLGYLDATSSIQTQLNGKEPTINTLSVAKGGTNSGTALNNNRVIKSSSGAIVEAAAITANRALISDADGIPTHSSVTETELGYVSGVTSAIQTQLGNKAPLVSPSFTTPDIGAATGTSLVVGTTPSLDASAALEVDSTTKGFLPPRMTQAQRDAIGSPATGLQVYNTTTSKVNVYDGATWVEVGSGQGGINYIADYDGSTLGAWATYADAASSQPTDGTGGSPTVTFVSSSSSAMRGTTNFLFTHNASNEQGQGFSYLCNIDPSDRGSVIRFGFEYLIASGTYADGDLTVWFYDVTNAQIIQGAPTSILNSGIIETFQSEVQVPISCAQMRVIVHVSTNTATAYTMRFDNFAFGPQEKSYGSLSTDPIAYSPAIVGFGTITTNQIKWSRRGKYLVLDGFFITGTPTGVLASVPFPSGLVGVAPVGLTNRIVGRATRSVDATVYNRDLSIIFGTSVGLNAVGFGITDNSSFIPNNPLFGNALVGGSNQQIHLYCEIEIEGWSSSSQVVSSEDDGRVVAARITTTQALSINTLQPTLIYETVVFDTHNAYSTTTGEYTVKVSGYYQISGNLYVNSVPTTVGHLTAQIVYLDGVANAVLGGIRAETVTSVPKNTNGSVTLYARAGQKITIRGYSDTTNTLLSPHPQQNYVTIERLSGRSQIMAGESVSEVWTTAAGQPVPNGVTATTIVYGTPVSSSHSAYNATTGIFKAPTNGMYLICATARYFVSNYTSAAQMTLLVNVNAQIVSENVVRPPSLSSLAGPTMTANCLVPLLAGQELYISTRHGETTSRNLLSSATDNRLSITKVGNYV
jgi:hypothetical protein